MNVINGQSLEELANEAYQVCKDNTVTNMILSGLFSMDECESDFIKMYYEKAKEWQASVKPHNLLINHGEFINRAGSGVEFLVMELKRKPNSNRACLSLISMGDIIKSGDDPIPSFVVAQFGFPNDDLKRILVTAYFRSIEVQWFLPVNLAELCLLIKEVKTNFPQVLEFELNLILFRAHVIPSFHCLEKALIDTIKPAEITRAVMQKNIVCIRRWIDSKMVNETAICTEGLTYLLDALELDNDKYKPEVLESISNAIEGLERLKEARKKTSEHKNIEDISKSIFKNLQVAKENL